ncbi:hypothetical protein TIFTF001_019430, partial [Ficus carica]
KLSY